MKCPAEATFWGLKLDGIEGVTQAQKKLLGYCDTVPGYISACLDQAHERKLNARQTIANLKGSFGDGEHPEFPAEVSGLLPSVPNVYTDGGLKCPATQWWALGGFGVWWPGVTSSIISGAAEATQFVYEDITAKGIGLWGRMSGQRNSSTRMEIAGFLIALMRNIPIMVATDSLSLVNKANAIIQTIKAQMCNPHWWRTPHRSAFGKPWGLQADGDLWKLVHEAIITRCAHTVAIVKVKGHATAEMVEQGKVKPEDKAGNDSSDTYATKGTNEHGSHTIELANWFRIRQSRYANFIKDVQTIIIEVLKAEKIERMARRAATKMLQGFDDTIYAMVSCTLPRDPHTLSVPGEGNGNLDDHTQPHTPSMLGEGAATTNSFNHPGEVRDEAPRNIFAIAS